jgi:ubiquinone/menaquinone biosynthesis C-methylase UbiE
VTATADDNEKTKRDMAETNPADPEIALLVEEWNRCIMEKDIPAAARLRDEGYVSTLPSGRVLTRDAELAMYASPDIFVRAITMRSLRTRRKGNRAEAVAVLAAKVVAHGASHETEYQLRIEFSKKGSEWRATSARHVDLAAGTPPRAGRRRSAVSWLKRLLRPRVAPTGSFQDLAYLAYRPGEDFVRPRAGAAPASPGDELPVPPRELWLGYDYPVHGAVHVKTMLDLAYASGLAFVPGDRILDLGCGAGRMIRHLRELADRCEIWGMDISAEHIFWCKENLSPPFHFATNTKVPHLPFEDRSFRFIYCGSLFTHIDDLADAWLLELRRILAPEGRLYVTIHDNHTIESFERGGYDTTPLGMQMRASETFQQARETFGMISIGRDNLSQVFYDAGYFTRMAGSMFEVISVTPGAYFYQTAFLLSRK